MSELLIIAVGKLGRGPEAELLARYQQRVRPKLTVMEVTEARLLAAVPAGAFVVALDLGGKAPDSETFAALVTRWLDLGKPVAFVIGGADGLDASVIARADYVLSLGTLTWPHLLVRVMLAEQLYRARAIASGHPYHRGGRP